MLESGASIPLDRPRRRLPARFRESVARPALERGFAAAVRLGLFEMAVRYWRMPASVPLHPWMPMPPFFLRHLLELERLHREPRR
jgi:hypothetical protein